MRAAKITLAGRERYLMLTVDAMGRLEEEFGGVRQLIDALEDRGRQGLSAPMRFCNFSPNRDCKKVAGRGVQPLNNYTCRFRPSSLKCTDKSGLDGLQADKWAGN